MDKVKVTVYIPSHNYGRFLKQAIESVLRQTFDNWELILIDDNSEDETHAIMNLYSGDPRIRVFHRNQDTGLIGAANFALKEANGDYIVRLDADDYFDENALLVLSHHLDRNKDTALVFSDFYMVDEQGGILSIERREKLYEINHLFDVPSNGACSMIRTQSLRDIGGYRTDIDAQDGLDVWIKISNIHKCSNINLPLFYYRRHGDNLTEKSYRIFNARRHIKASSLTLEMKAHRPVLAVIPCRQNYDFCPDLWNADIGGRNLLARSLEICINSDIFDEIVVASDTERVRKAISSFNDPRIRFFKRTRDETIRSRSITETLMRITAEMDPSHQGLSVLVHNQAPFMTTAGLEEAVFTTLINSADSAIAVKEVEDPIYKRTTNGVRAINPPSLLNSDFDMLFIETRTTLAAMNRNFLRGTLTGNLIVNFVLPVEESFFISSMRDLLIARVIAEIEENGATLKFEALETLSTEN